MWTYFIPLYVLGGIVLLFGIFVLLARVRGGRYIRPIVGLLAKVPFMRRLMRKASQAALERQNPDLANAIKKLERTGAERDPRRAQAALSRLSASERAAYLEAAGEQGAMPTPQNRQQRRQMEKMRKSPPRRKA